MNSKLNLAVLFTTTALAGCATTATNTIPENPSTVELAPMEMPEVEPKRFHQLDKQNDTERYFEHTTVNTDGTHKGRSHNGCSWHSPNDPFAPAFKWEGCGSNPEWSSGENRNQSKEGEMWPLAVGNQATYRYEQLNALGESQGKTSKTCKVMSQVNIDVAYGNVDAYKVQCKRRKGDWSRTQVWYFVPELGMPVKYVNATSSKGLEHDHEVTRVELL